jgi:endonuclease/exonuclease/phosphatase family metal-dependent hydrolase
MKLRLDGMCKRIPTVLVLFSIVLFFSCSEDSGYPVVSYPDSGRLVIATYNVEDFATYNSYPYDKVAKYMKKHNVDVIVLQEIQSGSVSNMLYSDGTVGSGGDTANFNRSLAKFVGTNMYPYYCFNNDGGGRLDYVGAWSRYPISDVASVKSPRMQDPVSGHWYDGYRPALKFRIQFKGKDIWFYGLHLKSNSGGDISSMEMRRAQAHHLANYIKINHNTLTDYVCILGDLNSLTNDYDNSGSSTIDILTMRYDNNSANDFTPVNLKHLGGETNAGVHQWSVENGMVVDKVNYSTMPINLKRPLTFLNQAFKSTLDHIILSPALYSFYHSVETYGYRFDDINRGASDHFALQVVLTNLQ